MKLGVSEQVMRDNNFMFEILNQLCRNCSFLKTLFLYNLLIYVLVCACVREVHVCMFEALPKIFVYLKCVINMLIC